VIPVKAKRGAGPLTAPQRSSEPLALNGRSSQPQKRLIISRCRQTRSSDAVQDIAVRTKGIAYHAVPLLTCSANSPSVLTRLNWQ
jgi:hypothetical protein